MNRRQPLILVIEPEIISSGLWPDRQHMQTPLWEVAENVDFIHGKVVRHDPSKVLLNTGGHPIRGIGQQYMSDGERVVTIVSGSKVIQATASTLTGLDQGPKVLGEELWPWVSDPSYKVDPTYYDVVGWGDWTLINSQASGVWIYRRKEQTFRKMTEAPRNAVALLKKRNQLIAVGYGANGKLAGFSDADDIFTWDATATNLAGELPLEELNSPVRAAIHFGGSIAILGDNQLMELRWIGAPFYYGVSLLLEGIGATGKFAACADGRMLYGVSRNGVWRSDGITATYVDEGVIRDWLQMNVNWGAKAKISCQKNDISGNIDFSFPVIGDERYAGWTFNPRFGSWARIPPFSVMQRRALLNYPLAGTHEGALLGLGASPQASGPLALQTKPMMLTRDGQALHVGAIIDEVEFMVNDAHGVSWRYACADHPNGPWSWGNWNNVDTGQHTHKLMPGPSGVYHKLDFRHYEKDWRLDLQGFALFGTVDGQKKDKL